MFTRTFSHVIVSCMLVLSSHSAFAGPIQISSPQVAVPPNITTSSNKPMLMLATSKDHTLFAPIYTDFEDLNDDGILDTDFKPDFKYYGYFDPTKCYTYSTSGSGVFEPAVNANYVNTSRINPATGVAETPYRYTCPSSGSYWSGNFMNWASTTRLDVVRKMLYGGSRSTDSNGTTVLERTRLNWDAHSFTKYYAGTDVRDYTPYSTADLTKTSASSPNTTNPGIYAGITICQTGTDDTADGGLPIMKVVKGNYRFWNTVEVTVCRYDNESRNANSTFSLKLARYYKGADGTDAATFGLTYGGGQTRHEAVLPDSEKDGATYKENAKDNAKGPTFTVRVKVCDPSMIGEERCQAFPPGSTTNFKPYGLFQEFGYGQSGSSAKAEFGVITGSYDNNVTAGGLRKNMGDFADEINPSTGIFCHNPDGACASSLAAPDGRKTGNGAIKALDKVLLIDRPSYGGAQSTELFDGKPRAWGNPIGEMVAQALQYYAFDGSAPASTNPTSTTVNGLKVENTTKVLPLQDWEVALDNTGTKRNEDRYSKYGNAICRPMHILALSSSALSFDNITDTVFNTLPNRTLGGVVDYTNKVGKEEDLNGKFKSVGSVNGTQGNSCTGKTIDKLATVSGVCPDAPAMMGSYKVAGAALYGNTSKIKTIASEPTDLKYVQDALKVKTLAASLSGGAARIDVLIPGSNPKKYVYITPESMWDGHIGSALTFVSVSSSATHGAFLVSWNDALMGGDHDMDLVGFLRYDLINNGGTWDIVVTTDVVNNCSGRPGTHGFSIIGVQKNLGAGLVDGNGRYLTHQHYSSNNLASISATPGNYMCSGADAGYPNYRTFTNASSTSHLTMKNWQYASLTDFVGSADNAVTNATGACRIDADNNYCKVQNKDFQIKMRFRMVGAEDAVLKDPLWYAAKYGNFSSSTKKVDGTFNNLDVPPNADSWDKFKSDGSPGADGIPDGYYLARRPDLLEAQLRKALDVLAKNANAAPAVSSAQLQSEGFKYIAKFDSTAVDGDIEAYQVDDLGYFNSTPTWRAGEALTRRTTKNVNADKGESRVIITNFGNRNTTSTTTDSNTGGFAFRWASLPSDYKTQMTTASTNRLSETNASLVIDYMRGDQTKEAASTGLRSRGDNILGPIVNATPAIQERPYASYSGSLFPNYSSYVTDNKARAKLLWVAANDGMLHAFNPTTGAEVFAYVPGALANRLAEIPLQRGTTGRTRLNDSNFTLDSVETQPTGTVWPYVDGNPFSGDILVSDGNTSTWKTYTFGALGRGGRAIYALNTGDISTLTSGEVEGNRNSIFKWQFTSDDDNDLGYIVYDILSSPFSNQPSPIVKLNNGKFALLLGNGQKSSNGKSVLFIIYTDGPNADGTWSGQYKKIVADSGSGNGMSAPTWIDLDGNGTADIVYAGDLKGNMWKFDLTSSTESSWGVAYKSGSTNLPLITAKSEATALPITTAPEFAYPPYDGLIITFGTGNSFESGNFPNTTVSQRIYGVWDRPEFAAKTKELPNSDASTLVERTYSRQSNGNVIVTAGETINWEEKDGWYFSLPGKSEMVLSDPDIQAGVLAFTTVMAQSSENFCSAKPDVASYAIDPITGQPERNIQGTTLVGTKTYLNAGVPALDQKVRIVSDRTKRAFTKQCRAGDAGCTCTTTNGVETCTKAATECPAGTSARRKIGQSSDTVFCYRPSGRMQWREIPGLRTDQ